MATAHPGLRVRTERFESLELPLGSSPGILPFGNSTHTYTHTKKERKVMRLLSKIFPTSWGWGWGMGSTELRVGELLPNIYDWIVCLSLQNRGESSEGVLKCHFSLH